MLLTATDLQLDDSSLTTISDSQLDDTSLTASGSAFDDNEVSHGSVVVHGEDSQRFEFETFRIF